MSTAGALPSPELLDTLQRLVGRNGDDELATSLLIDLLHTGVKLAQEGPQTGDLKILVGAVKELRHAFRVFAPYRDYRKVSIFGSARTEPSAPEYRQAFEFARRMCINGYMVITGAGGGIMAAAQGGAGREKSFGVNIRLPMEQAANETIRDDHKLINFKYFFTRKVVFIKETSAIALFPGGFGTHDEGFESLTLLQTGKSHPLPLVFIDIPGGDYWKGWGVYIEEHLLRRRLIDPEDMHLFKITDSIDEACGEITGFYRNYHSSRFVRDIFVIRLQYAVPEDLLEEINADFQDLLAGGRFESSAPFPEESNQPDLAHLPRLAFRFNRRSMGRLRRLIDRLNQAAPCSS